MVTLFPSAVLRLTMREMVKTKLLGPEAVTTAPDLDAPMTSVTNVDTTDRELEITFNGRDIGGTGIKEFQLFVSVDSNRNKRIGVFPGG
ncbi:MAG: hypothetical protein R3C05_21455 [Pirellulaceae bacterium]